MVTKLIFSFFLSIQLEYISQHSLQLGVTMQIDSCLWVVSGNKVHHPKARAQSIPTWIPSSFFLSNFDQMRSVSCMTSESPGHSHCAEREGYPPNTCRGYMWVKNYPLLGPIYWNLRHCSLEQLRIEKSGIIIRHPLNHQHLVVSSGGIRFP